MEKISWQGGALIAPVPAVMVSCGDMEKSNIITVAWCGITNTIPPKTYISVRPSRYSYNIIKENNGLYTQYFYVTIEIKEFGLIDLELPKEGKIQKNTTSGY